MSRPTEDSQSGIFVLFRRHKTRIHIKKRPKSPSEQKGLRQAFLDWRKHVFTWILRMTDKKNPAYSKVFFGALWGEMGEYSVRGSTLFGIALIISAIVMIWFLIGLRGIQVLRGLIAIVLFGSGINQLRDLGGPIWWADLYGRKQAKNFKNGKKVERYERYSNVMVRLRRQYQRDLPLKIAEIPYLAELYRQFCQDTMSEESWEELGKYTKVQVDFFYRVLDIGEGQKRFPEYALKQSEAA